MERRRAVTAAGVRRAAPVGRRLWLPNDPRGSWSDFVASWKLVRFGQATRDFERADVDRSKWAAWRAAVQEALCYPAVTLTGIQAREVGIGFGNGVRKGGYSIWACSILPEHVHLVLARHTYKVEQIFNLLKGEATKRLKEQQLHPQAQYADASGKVPSMWAERQWKKYLDSEQAIENAISYVEENPVKEGKLRQKWSFVQPFEGIANSGWVTYH